MLSPTLRAPLIPPPGTLPPSPTSNPRPSSLQVCSREEAAQARAALEGRLRAKGDLSEEQVAELLTPEVRPRRTGCQER